MRSVSPYENSRTGDVLDRRLPLERPERDDARDAILAVLLADVADTSSRRS